MDINTYLEGILSSQDLKEDSQELKDLRAERDKVRGILFSAFSDSPPSIRYAGSYAKGTLIKEAYDLDMTCYFDHDDCSAGDTLADIFESVRAALSPHYSVSPKTSALRLEGQDRRYFHIDVVPGRFVDDANENVFLHQNNGDKERLKTNLDVHLKFIKGSGLVSPIRLVKLWKTRRDIRIKQFVFELLVIELLRGKKSASLESQLTAFLEKVVDSADPIVPEDPANPYGNDLTPALNSFVWADLRSTASNTLRQIENLGWETVFGPIPQAQDLSQRISVLQQAAAVVTNPTRPWSSR